MTHIFNIPDHAHWEALAKGEKNFLILKPEKRIFEEDTIILQCTVTHFDDGTDKPYTAMEEYEVYRKAVLFATDEERAGLKLGWQAISLQSEQSGTVATIPALPAAAKKEGAV